MGTVAADLIKWMGGLVLSGGDLDGETMVVWPWQRRFVRGAFASERDAGLSVARGNGKSGLVAAIASAVVDPRGTLHRRRAEVIVVASSHQQARVVFSDVLEFIRQHHDLAERKRWRLMDSQTLSLLEHRESGARIRCVGSDPRRAHGLRPMLVLADEPAQWPPGTSDAMVAALRTGLGKTPGSRLIALGTRPLGGDHWFNRLLVDPRAYGQVHAARPGDPPFTLSTIRRANPSLERLPSLYRRVLAERDAAKGDVSRHHEWRSLRLNQGVADHSQSVLLDVGLWRRSEAEGGAVRGGGVWGIDLGTSAAMSAVACQFPDGTLDAVAAFPTVPDLRERGLADGVGRRYQEMLDRGELITVGERVSDVRALLSEALARFGRPVAVVADRWRSAELQDALDAIRFPGAHLVTRGQGWRDGGQDVRAFRRAFGEGRVRPVPSLLMRAAMAEARTVADVAGNEKLAKGSQGGRRHQAKDDAAAAAILAVAVAHRQWWSREPQGARRYRSALVR